VNILDLMTDDFGHRTADSTGMAFARGGISLALGVPGLQSSIFNGVSSYDIVAMREDRFAHL
jgi:hypothetical protein